MRLGAAKTAKESATSPDPDAVSQSGKAVVSIIPHALAEFGSVADP